MNLNDPRLTAVLGSWVRVQVAFYDYMFQRAMHMCPTHWKEMALEDASAGWSDGSDFYEKSVKAIEDAFLSPEELWVQFVDMVLESEVQNEGT